MTATTAIIQLVVVMVWGAVLVVLPSCAHPRHKPNLVELAFLDGMQAEKRGDLSEAASKFNQTTVVDPEFCSGYFNLGDIYERQTKPTEALSAFEKALICFKGKTPQSSGVYSATTLKLDTERTARRIEKLKGAISKPPQS